MSVGVCMDGRDGSVYATQPTKARSCLGELKPHTVRLPWVNNSTTHDLIDWCARAGIEVLVHDVSLLEQAPPYSPEEMVQQIIASGLPVYAVEGVNECDLNGGKPAPIDQAHLDFATSRQAALYNAVAGRWLVLSPSAAWWKDNESALVQLPHDIVSCHRYAPPRAPVVDDALLPNRPAWVTEAGWATYKKAWPSNQWVVSEEQQRDWSVSMRNLLLGQGADRVFVYHLMDTVQRSIFTQADSGPKNKGLFRYEGWAKLAVAQLKV